MEPPFDPPEADDQPDSPKKTRTLLGWLMPVSVVAHGVLLWILLFGISLPMPDPPKETPKDTSVSVDVVPPPEQKPDKKADSGVKPPPPAAKAEEQPAVKETDTSSAKPTPPSSEPQAFESSGTKADAPVQDQKTDDQPPQPDPQADTQPAATPTGQADTSAPAPQTQKIQADVLTQTDAKVTASPTETIKGTSEQKPVETPEKPAEKAASPADKSEKAAAQPPSPLTKAKTLLSKKFLSDPRVKKALGQLPLAKRLVQICTIEALEQVRHSRSDPSVDILGSSTKNGLSISGQILNVTGGAYHSKAGWYDVDYRCEANADVTEIVSFSMKVGASIPRSEWKSRALPAQ